MSNLKLSSSQAQALLAKVAELEAKLAVSPAGAPKADPHVKKFVRWEPQAQGDDVAVPATQAQFIAAVANPALGSFSAYPSTTRGTSVSDLTMHTILKACGVALT
mgnify:CR=1 FL=1